MSVITISRGSFSGGKMLAECLATNLGFRCVDRDVIVESAAARGVSQEDLRDALQKPPTLLERFQHKKYLYLALIQAALVEEVRTGRAVYHGNAGHLLLKGGPHILRVRVIAPLGFRVMMACNRLKITESEAIQHIQKMDNDRRKWTQYLYGVDWGDPVLYDVVINLEYMSIPEACAGLCTLIRQRCFEFAAEDQRAMDNLALASHVRADLALNEPTAHLEVEVDAEDGRVKVHGRVITVQEIEEVRRVIESVPGVRAVDLDELASPARA